MNIINAVEPDIIIPSHLNVATKNILQCYRVFFALRYFSGELNKKYPSTRQLVGLVAFSSAAYAVQIRNRAGVGPKEFATWASTR